MCVCVRKRSSKKVKGDEGGEVGLWRCAYQLLTTILWIQLFQPLLLQRPYHSILCLSLKWNNGTERITLHHLRELQYPYYFTYVSLYETGVGDFALIKLENTLTQKEAPNMWYLPITGAGGFGARPVLMFSSV